MAEKDCSLLNTSTALTMDIDQQDKKNVSKVFALLRSKLNAKEKELLELQRAEPCLLAPDSEQIDSLLDLISSLQLSTQDGSFLFAPKTVSNSSIASSSPVCSTGVDLIKTLPATVWLPDPILSKANVEDEKNNQYRLPMVTHLLSLPINAYVASSSSSLSKTKDQPANRLPMVSELFSMPINAFKSSSSSNNTPINHQSTSVKIEEIKETTNNNNQKKVLPNSEPPKSILSSETIYSKEHWLQKSSPSECDSTALDLDAYIEQSTEKMRRLHMEYLAALEKLKTPSNPVNSSEMIKSMYPQVFDRIQKDTSTKGQTRLFPSTK